MSDNLIVLKRLKALRKKSGLSMTEVSRRSQSAPDSRGMITQGYISRLEHGLETNPSLLKILTLCKIYRIKLGDLL